MVFGTICAEVSMAHSSFTKRSSFFSKKGPRTKREESNRALNISSPTMDVLGGAVAGAGLPWVVLGSLGRRRVALVASLRRHDSGWGPSSGR
jgi:hypothetical protein